VPGIGWWTCAAMIYVAVSCVGACIFVVETRRLKAAITFARREREARRLMGIDDSEL